VRKCLNINRSTLNFEETLSIDSSKKLRPTEIYLSICGKEFKYVTSTKYLDVFIDRNPTFAEHMKKICDKVSKKLGLLYTISLFSTESFLKRVDHALVFPYRTKCNLIWGGAGKTYITKILILQKRSVRINTNSEYLSHTEPLFKRLEILNIECYYNYSCCLFVVKNMKLFEVADSSYNARHNDVLKVNFARLELFKR